MKQKRIVMKPKPELSDQEIRSYMDFEGLLIKQKQASASTNVVKWGVVLLVGIVAAVFVWFLFRNALGTSSHEVAHPQTELPPVPEPELDNFPSTVQQDTLLTKPERKHTSLPLNAEKISSGSTEEKSATNKPEQDEALYLQAEPVQGYADLYQYFTSALVYPQAAIQDSVQGVFTVAFIINKEGKPEDITVTQSLGFAFDAEAIRLIQQMPSWKPATYKGKPVKSKITLPLTFQLKKVEVSHEQK